MYDAGPDVAGQAARAAAGVQEKVGSLIGEQGRQLRELAESQQLRAAEQIGGVATVFNNAARDLRSQKQEMIATLVERLGSHVEDVAQAVREGGLTDIVRASERVARRNPAIFIGGLFALGFGVGRFLKASAPAPTYPAGEYSTRYGSADFERRYGAPIYRPEPPSAARYGTSSPMPGTSARYASPPVTSTTDRYATTSTTGSAGLTGTSSMTTGTTGTSSTTSGLTGASSMTSGTSTPRVTSTLGGTTTSPLTAATEKTVPPVVPNKPDSSL